MADAFPMHSDSAIRAVPGLEQNHALSLGLLGTSAQVSDGAEVAASPVKTWVWIRAFRARGK